MKMMKRVYGGFLFLCSVFVCGQVRAQNKKADISLLLPTKNYLFTAQFAQPLSGNQITLTSIYTLRIAGDSLVCHLPYFGRTFIPESYPGGGGFMFTSHHFEYHVTSGKRGRYMVDIKINDLTNAQQMYLNVSKNGYAALQITSATRQPISYYGTVTALPAVKQ